MSSEATEGQTPDVYGQLHPKETKKLRKTKLKEFEKELEKLSEEETEYVKLAEETNPDLCSDEFKLMFLRCEVFNADLAAQRYANYWKKRVAIMGHERAFKPLLLSNFDEEIKTAFDMGVMTLLDKAHDPAGRAIIYFDPSKYDKTKYTVDTIIPAFWYILHAALEKKSAQQKGVIFLGDPGRATLSQFDRQVSKELISSLKGALPIRLSAMHMVHPPAFAKVVMPVVKMFMSERMKKRIVIHSGDKDQVLDDFESIYGLSRDELPTTIGGNYKVNHAKWTKKRSSSGL